MLSQFNVYTCRIFPAGELEPVRVAPAALAVGTDSDSESPPIPLETGVDRKLKDPPQTSLPPEIGNAVTDIVSTNKVHDEFHKNKLQSVLLNSLDGNSLYQESFQERRKQQFKSLPNMKDDRQRNEAMLRQRKRDELVHQRRTKQQQASSLTKNIDDLLSMDSFSSSDNDMSMNDVEHP